MKDRAKRTLVIGVGNRWRQDDGLGPKVVESMDLDCDRKIVGGQSLDLINAWEGYDNVVLVDAIAAHQAPGEILYFDEWQANELSVWDSPSTHGLGVAEAIQLGQTLGKLPKKIRLIGVVGRDFEMGEGLSEPVSAVIPHLVSDIQEIVQEWKG